MSERPAVGHISAIFCGRDNIGKVLFEHLPLVSESCLYDLEKVTYVDRMLLETAVGYVRNLQNCRINGRRRDERAAWDLRDDLRDAECLYRDRQDAFLALSGYDALGDFLLDEHDDARGTRAVLEKRFEDLTGDVVRNICDELVRTFREAEHGAINLENISAMQDEMRRC
jgi:hypothetical protein